ncbi:MAG TPA: vitamin K epoxide reductase family protein [Pyrinomonadaceae bacterium]|jgi:uncharacterized membrane protein|nr:vitamin K epoxide reductase family protein [Pyrinomonadaceae bacterium]
MSARINRKASTLEAERRTEDPPQQLLGGRAAWFYTMAALLSLVGLADALYLTINHLTGQTARCTVAGGCNEVLGSTYASVGGVPIAALGAIAYFAVFSLATLALFGYGRARTLLALLVGLMLLASLWLLFVQAFILHKFCDYCLLSAAVTLMLAGIVVASRLVRARE